MDVCKICGLLVVSLVPVAVFLVMCFRGIVHTLRNRRNLRHKDGDEGDQKITSLQSSILLLTLTLFVAIWAQRGAVGYYLDCNPPDDEYVKLTCVERLLDSMVHALQTFSMDEDYSEYLQNGKTMISAILPPETSSEQWENLYGGYTSLLNTAAPVLGGAILFELITNLFPSLALLFSFALFWKKKYYFSELNENSVALVRSIRNRDRFLWTRPVLIITDAYVERDNEKSNELRLEAKSYGAICIQDDLAHIWKSRKRGRNVYFLIDKVEIRNLQALTYLTEKKNRKFIRGSKIYLFSQNNIYAAVEKAVEHELAGTFTEKNDMPTITPVQSYRNLVSNLLVELPLFEPLVDMPKAETDNREKERAAVNTAVAQKKTKKELYVTILGFGNIGLEMFLAVYWLGQMLDCDLYIQVVSKESEEEFWKKIDFINPEIRKTVRVYKNNTCENPDENMLKYRDNDSSDPYAHVRYYSADVKSGSLISLEQEETNDLLKTNYFVVALGSDEDNLSVAEKLRMIVGKAHIDRAEDPDISGNTVIAYAVFDSDLCRTLNRQCISKETPDICMRAFGSLEEVYSYDNVFMSKYRYEANGIGQRYLATQMQNNHKADSAARSNKNVNYNERDYKNWADLARAMHVLYKAYSIGWIQDSVFTVFRNQIKDGKPTADVYAESRACMKSAYERYRIGCVNLRYQEAGRPGIQVEDTLVKNKEKLSWLEHRRWCAFTRVRGFQGTDKYVQYFDRTGSYKHMSLQLHPCLLECGEGGICSSVDGEGDNKTLVWQNRQQMDALDKLSEALYKCTYQVMPSSDEEPAGICERIKRFLRKVVDRCIPKECCSGEEKQSEPERYNTKPAGICKRIKRFLRKKIDRYLPEECCNGEEKQPETKRYNTYDFKVYDYPTEDFSDIYLKEAAGILGWPEDKLKRMCEKGKLAGAYLTQDHVRLIPEQSVTKILEKKYIRQKAALEQLKKTKQELDELYADNTQDIRYVEFLGEYVVSQKFAKKYKRRNDA